MLIFTPKILPIIKKSLNIIRHIHGIIRVILRLRFWLINFRSLYPNCNGKHNFDSKADKRGNHNKCSK